MGNLAIANTAALIPISDLSPIGNTLAMLKGRNRSFKCRWMLLGITAKTADDGEKLDRKPAI